MTRKPTPKKRRGGRQKGTPNKVTAATRERIEKEADPIGFLCSIVQGEALKVAPAKNGAEQVEMYPTMDQRLSAAQALARKVQPDAKDTTIQIDLPELKAADDAVAAAAAVLAALARGEITPNEAQAVSAVVESFRRAIETEDLEKRIAELERRAS